MINYANITSSHVPSFSCRLMAFYNPSPGQKVDKGLAKEFLLDSSDSLKQQSRINKPVAIGDKENIDIEDVIKNKDGNQDGWGALIYNKNHIPVLVKSQNSALNDENFNTTIDKLLNEESNIFLTHIRWASLGCNPGKTIIKNGENNHPFVYENWSFMHNGFLSGAVSEKIGKKINVYSEILGDRPKGTTDSERAFYYFLGKLKEKYPDKDLNSESIGIENVKDVFAEAMSELVEKSFKTPREYKLPSGGLTVSDRCVKCNAVISDGKVVMAYKKGHTLFLGMYKNSRGEKNYIISSEKVNSDKFNMEWWFDIPDKSVVVLEPEKDADVHWLK